MDPKLKSIPYKPEGVFPSSWRFDFLSDPLHSRVIMFTCPNGHLTVLHIDNRADREKNWKIHRDGEVSPSVFCHGNRNPDCGYHEFIYLEEWRPEWINQ